MDFLGKHWGDLAGVLGLALTIWFSVRAKTAAEQARDAAKATKDRIFSLDTIKELTAEKAYVEGDPSGLDIVRFNQSLSVQMDDLEKARIAIERAET